MTTDVSFEAVCARPVGTDGACVSVHGLVGATIVACDERLEAASYASTPSE